MPINVDPALINELVQRELKQDKAISRAMPKQEEASIQPSPLGPKTAMLLGGLADAGSTLAFLKSGKMKEANPAFEYFNKNPWSVVPTAAATGLGYHFLHKLLKNKSPKIADTAAGLLGGFQMALGGSNLEGVMGTHPTGNSYDSVKQDFSVKK